MLMVPNLVLLWPLLSYIGWKVMYNYGSELHTVFSSAQNTLCEHRINVSLSEESS